MKLNYKKTIFIGFAFFLICAFWQAYDAIVPLMLVSKFGLNQTWSGVIMALDNILALAMLPLFGALSDKRKEARYGKRTPYIIVGSVFAVIMFFGLAFVDYAQLKSNLDYDVTIGTSEEIDFLWSKNPTLTIKDVDENENIFAVAFADTENVSFQDYIKNSEPVFIGFVSKSGVTYEDWWNYYSGNECSKVDFIDASQSKENLYGTNFKIPKRSDILSLGKEGCAALGEVNYDKPETGLVVSDCYTKYIAVARNAYAWNQTVGNPVYLIIFIFVLLFVVMSMCMFRSPAVALMPDITLKPLRSKANAIINLMGAAGGVIILVLGMVLKTTSAENEIANYIIYIGGTCVVMLLALLTFVWKVDEKRFVNEMKEDSAKYGIDSNKEKETDEASTSKLSKPMLRSLLLILASVSLWFIGYNAITSKFSVYSLKILDKDYNTSLLIAQVAAIFSYIPVGMIASKFGRKKTILAGVALLTAAFACGAFASKDSSNIFLYVLFALAGIGWATINVNSFPMAVELSKDSNIGKYTGYYYTASMSAQIITPILSGVLMDAFGMEVLFPYAAFFVGLAFITMLFVKHGDSKPVAPKDKLEMLADND